MEEEVFKKLVYLDYNLFSILKNPRNPEHILLLDFIKANVDKIQLVYSDAHLEDLSKGNVPELIEEDLKNISRLTNNLSICKYWGESKLQLQYTDINESFRLHKLEQNSGCIGFIKWLNFLGLNNSWPWARNTQVPKAHQIDIRLISNYSISQIDQLVAKIGIYDSLDEWIVSQLQLKGKAYQNDTIFDYYITAYNTLDFISFYPDKLSERNKFENLFNDARHSAYGSQSDVFITNDNNCYLKSKFLFSYIGSKSKLIKTVRVRDLNILSKELNSILD
ncbi:hypothetical protein QWY31_06945 [Cytophagales bacterium LB-30]|uniref:DUF4942 domain-containing protein n=1 Tax=Shiella aurantiaca TaxID=3058365 RepID=A0ABT8F4A2_9BACT|nr:hypothetical protein [Shiella aurantiaca]MDN4165230.1 hypothetical protein [Shiella aurantiaca]